MSDFYEEASKLRYGVINFCRSEDIGLETVTLTLSAFLGDCIAKLAVENKTPVDFNLDTTILMMRTVAEEAFKTGNIAPNLPEGKLKRYHHGERND